MFRLPRPAGRLALLLPLLLGSVTGQATLPVPPTPVTLAPVGMDLPQYPSYIAIAAKIRRGMFARLPTLEQLGIRAGNGTVTVHGQQYQLDDSGGATVNRKRLQVSADAVSIDGVWHYPAATAAPSRRRKPDWQQLPAYDGRGMQSVQLETVLSVTVPAAATMLVLLLCCLGCTHQRCWCCGICDGQLNRLKPKKVSESDEQLLAA